MNQTAIRGDWGHRQRADILFNSANTLERAAAIVVAISIVLFFTGILSLYGVEFFDYSWRLMFYVGIPLSILLLLLTLVFRFRARYLSTTNKMLAKDLLILVLLTILIAIPILVAIVWPKL